MNSHRAHRLHPVIRAAVALACGAAIGSIAYVGAWQRSDGNYIYFADHYRAVEELGWIESAIARHIEQNGERPPEWSNLESFKWPEGETTEHGVLLDPWQHPFHYRVTDDGHELLSLGRDGLPGGLGLDADIPSQPPQHFPGSATLRQFTFELPTGSIHFTCTLAAICTAIACWVLMNQTAGDPAFFKLIAWSLTLGFACVIAKTMAVLHVPSGH